MQIEALKRYGVPVDLIFTDKMSGGGLVSVSAEWGAV